MTLKFQISRHDDPRIIEIELPFIPILEMLPKLTPELLAENRHWMQPDALDQNDFVKLCVQPYVVETPHHTILIDTCFGNDKPRPRPEWNMKSDSAYLTPCPPPVSPWKTSTMPCAPIFTSTIPVGIRD